MFPQYTTKPTLMDYLNCIILQLSQLEALLRQSMANTGSFKNLSVVLKGCKEKFTMLDKAKERIIFDYEKGILMIRSLRCVYEQTSYIKHKP
jgi:hypothetical protein